MWRRTLKSCRRAATRIASGSKDISGSGRIVSAVAALLGFIAFPADAHVKWFCAYDVTVPPLPLNQVLTPTFLLIAVGFAILLFVGFALDRAAVRSGWSAVLDRFAAKTARFQSATVRAGVGVFFFSLWSLGGIILTPELQTASSVIPWIQLAIAVGTLTKWTSLLSGLGILGLYGFAERQYGFFHLMDYPVFIGIAIYLILTPFQRRGRLDLRMPILYATAGFTLMWAAIEKFGYPMWTEPLLIEHSRITLGMDFDVFMIMAGFVEFTLAFFLITGTALLRLGTFYLFFIFAVAIIDFGMIDAVGHLLIIVALGIMTLNGKTVLQDQFRLDDKMGVLSEAGAMTALSFVVLAGFFGLYYGLQRLG
jgi:hypothetical protein